MSMFQYTKHWISQKNTTKQPYTNDTTNHVLIKSRPNTNLLHLPTNNLPTQPRHRHWITNFQPNSRDIPLTIWRQKYQTLNRHQEYSILCKIRRWNPDHIRYKKIRIHTITKYINNIHSNIKLNTTYEQQNSIDFLHLTKNTPTQKTGNIHIQ